MVLRKANRGLGLFTTIAILAVATVAVTWGVAVYKASESLGELFAENKRLKEAVANLTFEEQIGYAKVDQQQTLDGQLHTTLLFHDHAPGSTAASEARRITLPGDVIHFDALVISFSPQLVQDGKERAMYLWRRIYSDQVPPEDGLDITPPGEIPERYRNLFAPRSLMDRLLLREDEEPRFWQAIWQLSAQPELLASQGVRTVQGNAVYTRMQPGLIYVFKFTASGQILIETVPDL